MKKPYKVLSASALAAVLASSALVPVATQAASANQVTDVIVTENGVNYKMTQAQYNALLDAGKASAYQVKYVKSSTGKIYTVAQYNNALDAAGNVGEALDQLDEKATAQNITTEDAKFDSNGNLITTPVTSDLKVESVTAINANEFKVTFNQEVTAETANNVANYEVEVNGNASWATLAAKLQTDKKSVIIRATNQSLTVGDKIVVQVKDGIKGTNGKAVERFTTATETYLIAEAPQFVSAKFVPANGNPGKFQVTFDRPVANVATTLVKIDGIALTDKTFALVGANTPGNYTYEVDVATGTEFNTAKTVGSHEVVIFDVAETAVNNPKVNSVINTTYTVNADVTAPVVQSVTAVNANKFFVEFSEAVTLDADLSKSITVKKGNLTFPTLNTGTVTSHGSTTANTFVSAPTTNSDGKHGVYVVVNDTNAVGTANPLYGANETSVNLDVTVENYKDGVDLLGTKYNGSVTLTKGTATPKATKSVVNSGSKALEVLFDSSLTAAPTAANLVVRDKDGVIIPTASVTPAPSLGNTIQGDVTIYTNRVVTIGLAPAYQDKGPYTVTFKKDAVKYAVDSSTIAGYSIENNGNKEFDYVVGTAADNNFKYQVLAASSASVSSNVIAINYAVDMGNSARDVANYTLDGKALPAGTKVDFFGDKKTVHITLPKETVKATTDYKLTINTAVQTTTGQAIVKDLQSLSAYEQTIGLTDNTRPVLASAEYLVGSSNATTSNQVILKFSESLDSSLATSLAGTDFSVIVNGNTIAVTGLQNTDQNDEYVILSLDTAVSVSQAATISVKTDVVNNENSEIKDAASLPLNASSVTASNKTLDARGNGFVAATVNPTLAQVLQLGETTTGTLAGGTAATKAFTSSDTAVATVNPTTGAVTAVTAGTTTINYVGKNAAGGIVETGSVVVTVHAAAATGDVPTVGAPGSTNGTGVAASGHTAPQAGETITWTVTNGTGSATINSTTGAVTGVTAGDVTVAYKVVETATGKVVAKSAPVTVTIPSVPYTSNISATNSTVASNVTSKIGTSSTVTMTIKDDNGDPVLNIDSSKFVISVTGGTLQTTGVFGSISENSNGQYEFVVNNTGGRTGDAVFTIVVDGVTIGTVTHTITAS